MDKKKTGELIKNARIRKNYTQSELGGLIGVSNKAVSRWETGESFPDIGLLESLSNVLDLKIQDIVVGEIRADDETAFTEIVRMSRLQAKAKRNAALRCAVGFMITLYSCFIGYAGLGSKEMLDGHTEIICFISLAVILTVVLLLYLIVSEKNTVSNANAEKVNPAEDNSGNASPAKVNPVKGNLTREKGNVQKYAFPASVISGVWIICAVFFTAALVRLAENEIIPFSMDASFVGPFLCYQLAAVFLFNLVIMAAGLYGIGKETGYADKAVFVSAAVLYLVALYGDALHRLTEAGEFYRMMLVRTAVVLAELVIFMTAARILKKRKKR